MKSQSYEELLEMWFRTLISSRPPSKASVVMFRFSEAEIREQLGLPDPTTSEVQE